MAMKNWKKILAREWLCLICSLPFGIGLLVFMAAVIPDANPSDGAIYMTLLAPYFVLQAARATKWALRVTDQE